MSAILPAGGPVWLDGGRAVVLGLHRSTWDAEREDYLLGPAIVLAIRLGEDGPTLEVLASDPATDLIVESDQRGGYRIRTLPYRPRYCGEG